MTADRERFEEALKLTLQFEGGFSNNPLDSGGATMKGVTQRVYDGYRRNRGLKIQSVKSISNIEVSDIYYNQYWLPAQCDELKWPLAAVEFDTAVNFGVHGAVTMLQRVLGGLTVDGDFGPKTRAKVLASNQNKIALAFCDARIAWRKKRVLQKPSQIVFLKGWLNRDNTLKKFVTKAIPK